MWRSLSPVVRRELENLDKDADSRKLAMKALKSYVKDLDSKAIPQFLAQVSETKETGTTGEYTISLFEVLARVHGPKIVPQMDNIMSTIVKTLMSSAGSFALHQACSKVVPAIARYGMDPTTPEEKKRHIIHSLCKPLSDCLLGSHEALSSGAALCLKALVECDNWRYASNDLVNEVCQRVAGALDKHVQTSLHMALVMSLARYNSLIVDAYARLLVHHGLHILNEDVNSQKRLTAIHMVNSLMKCLDPKSFLSELDYIIKAMEDCQSDPMAYVSGAAFEALQTARKIMSEKGTKFDRDNVSVTGSNYDRRSNTPRRNIWSYSGSGDQSPLPASPESQTVNSFAGQLDSPFSTNQASPEHAHDRRSVNRKLWSRYGNGAAVNISLADGIFSEITRGSAKESSEQNDYSGGYGDYANGFEGFLHDSARNRGSRSPTPSPQRSRSLVNVDNVTIFSTPRKLLRSLQDEGSPDSDEQDTRFRSPDSGKQDTRFRSPDSDEQDTRFRSPSSAHKKTPPSKYVLKNENLKMKSSSTTTTATSEELQESTESVSSTEGVPLESVKMAAASSSKKWKVSSKMVGALLVVLLAMICWLLLINDQKNTPYLVPT